jgi:NAD(P)-dependent dehydrogenase (short-subunit alcohol dehydrogenase family)
VVLACRDAARGDAARNAIARETGNEDVLVARVDLASQASILAFASAFSGAHPKLHVLVNNAGVWLERRQETVDGIETTWATNVLGYHLLTELLLPVLRAAAPSRIVNVVSRLAYGLDLGDVEFRRRAYRGRDAYAQSKQADRMLTWALARRLDRSGVTANAVHPGFVHTDLFHKAGGLLGTAATAWAALRGLSPEEGADTVAWLAASPEVAGRSGLFWSDRRERPCPFRGEAQEEKLLALCSAMTGGSRPA